MRSFLIALGSLATLAGFAAIAPGCGDDGDSTFDGGGASSSGGEAGTCVGFGCTGPNGEGGRPGCNSDLSCAQVDCAADAKTTLTGQVFDPAGKVPLYNAVVYVPDGKPNAITPGLGDQCDRCDGNVSGNPIAITLTDANGNFRLTDVPAGIDFPLVIQIGKWRRTVTIPKVASCATAPAAAELTRLPRNRTEGDIPRIALTTGSADPLECLLHKIGLDDSEFGVAGSDARVHLFTGGSTAPATATSSLASGAPFTTAGSLWGSAAELKKYDLVMLACEGGELPDSKPVAARQALYDYAAVGGRVFTSHFHHYWFSNSPVEPVRKLAEWTNDFTGAGPYETEGNPAVALNATVNTAFQKGAAMKAWLKNTGSLTGPNDTLPIVEAKVNVNLVNAGALSWMTIQNPASTPTANKTAHEYITFNTPVGASDAEVCGRVVYSDLHVGAGDATGTPFPSGCTTTELTPQQKALEFMLFDLSSCIQKDDQPPSVPK